MSLLFSYSLAVSVSLLLCLIAYRISLTSARNFSACRLTTVGLDGGIKAYFNIGVDNFYNISSQNISANFSYKHPRHVLFVNSQRRRFISRLSFIRKLLRSGAVRL